VPGAGFQSITSAVQLVARRARESGKPVRVLYLSDFDPAGDKMPAAIARQIEFWLPLYVPGAEVKLTPLGLTRAQVVAYALPTIPIKDSDSRKGNFEKKHGGGAVEVDALEALYPGELARIVRAALDPYIDPTLADRLFVAGGQAQDRIADEWEDDTLQVRTRLAEVETEAQAIYGRYEQELDELRQRLEQELAPVRATLDELRQEVDLAQATFAPTFPARPQSTARPGEAPWLYESQRTYLEQLGAYKSHGNSGAEDED
jgi:hypothetical protein